MCKEPQKEKPTEVENLNNEWKSLKIHTRDFGGPKFDMGFAWFGIINGKPCPDQTKVLEYILSQGRKFVSARTKSSKESICTETWNRLNASIVPAEKIFSK